jgi:hypothetical protein
LIRRSSAAPSVVSSGRLRDTADAAVMWSSAICVKVRFSWLACGQVWAVGMYARARARAELASARTYPHITLLAHELRHMLVNGGNGGLVVALDLRERDRR